MTPPASKRLGRRGLIGVLLCIVPLSQVPLDIYTPALPRMVDDLHASPAALQNTVTAYMLGLSVAFIPLGVLADARGRRPILLCGLVVAASASVVCALAPGIEVLLAARFVQGAGAASCMVLSYAMAADTFRGAQLTSVSGWLGAAWGLAPVLAPAVGGVLVQFLSWRLIFGLMAVVIAAVGVLVVAVLPETLAPDARSAIAIGETWRNATEVIRRPGYLRLVVVFGLMASAQLAFGVVGPFLYQDGLGFSPAGYGAIALVVGAVNLLGELACGYFAMRCSPGRLASAAFAIFAVGAALLLIPALAAGTMMWPLTLGAMFALAGCGVLCPQMYGLALGLFEKNLGLVGGIATTVSYLIVSVAMAVMGIAPETSPAPLGWLYVFCLVVAVGSVAGLGLFGARGARNYANQHHANQQGEQV
ncbi:multidrug effflux MFS transporter [Gordonia sp. TBRC 11910]|uniref:Multidrug effflux MFS transporter n=1 Tax=Gordonia asplenii TaxID=2725283 RepID=A0A848L3K4_9ACTN|nr:multidrug effflux MFS transporter [Gordonia asplenii]NMO05012.1 multidrug effflux MFS transporter [Gordonia asplenii]